MQAEAMDREATHRYRLSWTAYVLPTVAGLVSVGFSALLTQWQMTFGMVTCVVGVLAAAVQILEARSTVLFANELGVWVYRGILPWTKGTTGVKWRDLEALDGAMMFFDADRRCAHDRVVGTYVVRAGPPGLPRASR